MGLVRHALGAGVRPGVFLQETRLEGVGVFSGRAEMVRDICNQRSGLGGRPHLPPTAEGAGRRGSLEASLLLSP